MSNQVALGVPSRAEYVLNGLLLLCVIAVVLNNVGPVPWEGTDDEDAPGMALKLHHITTVVLAIASFRRLGGGYPWQVVLYFLVAVLTSVGAFMVFPFNAQFANLVYCGLLVVTFRAATRDMPYERVRTIVAAAFSISLVAICIKNLFFVSEIKAMLNSGYRVWIYGLIAGGPNQEGTQLALATTLMVAPMSFVGFLVPTAFLNVIYMSRGGLIVLAGVAAYRGRDWLRQHWLSTSAALIAVVVLVSSVSDNEIVQRVQTRFTDIGDDSGSLGRVDMLYGAKELLHKNVFGYGTMNAVPVAEARTGMTFDANNLHNIYLQTLVDLGVQGLVAFLLMIGWVVLATARSKQTNVLGHFLIAYYFAGFLRFRAYDPFAFMMLGLFISSLTSTNPTKASGSETD